MPVHPILFHPIPIAMIYLGTESTFSQLPLLEA